ncbi:MAG: heme-binding protein [Myxococcota bacterium]|nr:heme-binding protein [Myxococcota bacterium]
MEWTRFAGLGVGVLAMVGLGTVLVRSGFAGRYEEPAYSVCLQQGELEVRDYTPRLLAEVTLTGDRKTTAGDGFRILASYIFSRDTPSGEPIGMTVPVGQVKQDDAWRMWFVLPSRYTRETLPPPSDDRIRIVEQPAERIAVLRRRGRMDKADFSGEAARLEDAARAAGLIPTGPATLAVYNGPLTPGPFRRNEVLLPVEDAGDLRCGAGSTRR